MQRSLGRAAPQRPGLARGAGVEGHGGRSRLPDCGASARSHPPTSRNHLRRLAGEGPARNLGGLPRDLGRAGLRGQAVLQPRRRPLPPQPYLPGPRAHTLTRLPGGHTGDVWGSEERRGHPGPSPLWPRARGQAGQHRHAPCDRFHRPPNKPQTPAVSRGDTVSGRGGEADRTIKVS